MCKAYAADVKKALRPRGRSLRPHFLPANMCGNSRHMLHRLVRHGSRGALLRTQA